MILYMKLRTGSLNYMRRGFNVVLRKKKNQKMSLHVFALELFYLSLLLFCFPVSNDIFFIFKILKSFKIFF